jgi:hypothetical protein
MKIGRAITAALEEQKHRDIMNGILWDGFELWLNGWRRRYPEIAGVTHPVGQPSPQVTAT